MNPLFIFIAVVFISFFIIVIVKRRTENPVDDHIAYQYKRRNFFLTRAEHECFDILSKAVGNDYLVFAQVHLPTLLDNKVVGQNWRGAFSHISQKSVDFVLCDKAYISPKLAIEVDDRSHERPDRQERDHEVERILKEAGIPLLRIENHGSFTVEEISKKVKESLNTA